MKAVSKSLLSKRLNERDSQNFEFLNIKPRLILSGVEGLRRLKYILVILFLLGYYPAVNLSAGGHRGEVLAAEHVAGVHSDSLPYTFNLPHPGYLSTSFSYYHKGVDLAAGLGMPIRPIAPGEVVRVDYGFFGLGHEVTISHSGGFKSTYGHMGRIFVRIADQVSQTTMLGEVGLTGYTSGPHTHLEIQKGGKYIDPQTVLPKIPPFPNPLDFQPTGGLGTHQNEIQNRDSLHKTLKPDFS